MERLNAEIREFSPKTASDAEWLEWNRLSNAIREETAPEDPPITLQQSRESNSNTPAHFTILRWGLWENETLLGRAWADKMDEGENQHVAWFGIQLYPERRRQGLGRRFLQRVVETAEAWDRRLLMSGSSDRIPAGALFFERIGARPGLRMTANQLLLTDLPPGLLGSWQQHVALDEMGLAAELWRGPYPEERFEDVIAMKEGCNLMPRGDLELKDDHLTVEQLREYNVDLVAKRVQRLTLVLRDLSTGRIAGYTETFWHPDRTEVLEQGDTAVFPEYQNRGLGRWLKATMLQHALDEWPQVKRVRTGNAHSNAPMLKINHEMGFRLHHTNIEWQVETARVRQYLEG